MPTTNEEAQNIVSISRQYLSETDMKTLFIRLDDEVGKFTDNDSLKVSLMLMRRLVDPPLPPAPSWVKPALVTLVTLHLIVVFCVLASFFALPFYEPWYICYPLMSFIFFFSSQRVGCKCTDLENSLRKKLGWQPIGGFVGHHLLRRIKAAYSVLLDRRKVKG